MKTIFIPPFRFSFALIALILFVSCNDRKGSQSNKPIDNGKPLSAPNYKIAETKDTSQRQSIAFILGEDKNTKNPYYTEATRFYTYNPAGKTSIIETKWRSLSEVRNYISRNKPSNGQPWGNIHLISHGDQWLGLSVKVTSDSKRSTTDRLINYLTNKDFTPLNDSIIDQHTEIHIHACGVGNNPELVEVLSLVFRTHKFIPKIVAPKLFEFYSSYGNPNGEFKAYQLQTRAWMISFKKEEKPSNIAICNIFHEKYPAENNDWQDAMTREHPRFKGDTYSYWFDIPVNLVINFPNKEAMPDLSTDAKKIHWINQQSEIQDNLQKIQISAEHFSWSVKAGSANDKTGKRTPAILVKGYCTMFCILKPLTDGFSNPIVPAESDTAFFYALEGKVISNDLLAENKR